VIPDPWFKTPCTIQSLVFRVDKLEGATVDKLCSVLADRINQELTPYLEGRKYLGHEFVVIKDDPDKFLHASSRSSRHNVAKEESALYPVVPTHR